MNTETFFTALLSYFIIVDPVGSSIIFAALTVGKDAAYSRKTAWRAVLLSIIIVLAFGFFGAKLLAQLGITIESFRIAGGLLLFYTAFKMITEEEIFLTGPAAQFPDDISVFPLSFPLIAGPGCLTLTVLLFAEAGRERGKILALLGAVLMVFSLTLLGFLFAERLSSLFGRTGNNIVKRLLGVLLAALSIQFIADGIMGFIHG